MNPLEYLRQRQRRVRRNLEAIRLKRIRRTTTPPYSYCKNCGTPLKGMYCHCCGQYALDTHQPMWKYFRQYFENMYQYDGKLWITLRLLFTRPGFLTREFNAGRINSYMHPFRLYMLVSVLFFTIFFMLAQQQTDLILLLSQCRSIPRTLVNDLKQGQAGPDTTVYARHAEIFLQALEFEGLERVDTLVRWSEIDEDLTIQRVTLPLCLLDSCFRPSSLSEDEQKEFRIIRKTFQELHKNEIVPSTETERRYIQLFQDLQIDTLTCLPRVPIYDWMKDDSQMEMLRERQIAINTLGSLSKWTPFYLMGLLPLLALFLQCFFPKAKLRYMQHFSHAVHINTIVLLLLIFPAYVMLVKFSKWSEGYAPDWLTDAFLFLPPIGLLLYVILSFHTVYQESWLRTLRKGIIFYLLFSFVALSIALLLILRLIYWVSHYS